MFFLKKEFFLSILLAILYVYSFIPTEGETSTLPMIVRAVAVCFVMVAAISSLLELRFYFAIPILLIVFYITVLCAISFSFRYFVALVVILAGFCWALAYYQNDRFRRASVSSIDFLLYFSVGFLILQFLEYYLIGRLFDYHNLVFPWSEARLPLYSSLARVGGIYIEPGTYANWVYAFLLFRLFADRNVNPLIVPLISSTMIFSMSAWGVIVGLYLLCVYATKKFDYKIVLYFLGAAVGAYVVVLLVDLKDVWALLENRLLYSGSRAVRDDTFQEFLGVLPDVVIFGLGFGNVFCVDCQSPQDAGLIISLVVVYGMAFTAFVLGVVLFFAYQQGGLRLLALCLPLLSAKLFYWEHVFWFLFMLALLGIYLRPFLDRWSFGVAEDVNPEGRF